MSDPARTIVLELAPVEGMEVTTVLPEFGRVAGRSGATPIRGWTHPTATYVVVSDPGRELIEALAQAAGITVVRAARLEISEELLAGSEGIEVHLPEVLIEPIVFPKPAVLDPRQSIEPQHSPLVVCPNCPVVIHPGPVCPPRAQPALAPASST